VRRGRQRRRAAAAGAGPRHRADAPVNAAGRTAVRRSILISHLHWDHTHGLPFFDAGLQPGNSVRVLMPTDGTDAEELLSRGLSPPHFPVRPRELGGNWSFEAVEPGWQSIEGYDVLVEEIPHKGGRTFGFRVEHAGTAIAYLSDHAPLSVGPGPDGFGERHPATIRLADRQPGPADP